MEPLTSQSVIQIMTSLGTDLCGIAGINRFDDAPYTKTRIPGRGIRTFVADHNFKLLQSSLLRIIRGNNCWLPFLARVMSLNSA